MDARLLELKTLSSTRVGAGRGLGHVDLPIVREKATNYPYLPGSGIKGVWADECKDASEFKFAFGRGGTENESSAGSLIFTDARLLALPILSFYGTFALVTCPTILNRLKDDLAAFGSAPSVDVPSPTGTEILAKSDSALKRTDKIYLLDVDLNAVGNCDAALDALAQRFPIFQETEVQKRFAIVSDDVFAFLCETGTEVNSHIRIDSETKTVANGALWYEETVPAETIFYGFAYCDRVYGSDMAPGELLDKFCPCDGKKYLQFGGKASTGKGRCACSFLKLN